MWRNKWKILGAMTVTSFIYERHY